MIPRLLTILMLLTFLSHPTFAQDDFVLEVSEAHLIAAKRSGVPVPEDMLIEDNVFFAIVNAPEPFDLNRIPIGVAPNGQKAYLYALEEAEWFSYNAVSFSFDDISFPVENDVLLNIGSIEASASYIDSDHEVTRTVPAFIYLSEGQSEPLIQ